MIWDLHCEIRIRHKILGKCAVVGLQSVSSVHGAPDSVTELEGLGAVSELGTAVADAARQGRGEFPVLIYGGSTAMGSLGIQMAKL